MLRNKYWLLMVMALFLMVGMLAGCGPEETVVPDTGPEEAEEAEEEVAIDFPTKDIKWVISRDPGDGQDTIARGIAPYLSQELGVNVVVDNMPGAGGRVGFEELNRQDPDGHYIGQDVLGSMCNFEHLGDLDYPLIDVEWFAVIYSSPAAIWVGADSGIETVQDLIDMDRPVKIGESSIQGTHVPWTMALFNALGIEYEYVTGFGGRPEIATAAMRQEIDMVSSSVAGYASLIGDLHAVMVMGNERNPLLPDTPTLAEVAAELGQPDITRFLPMGMATYMVSCPPDTPREVTAILEEAFRKVIEENADFQQWAEEANMDAHFVGYDELRGMIDTVLSELNVLDFKGIVEASQQ